LTVCPWKEGFLRPCHTEIFLDTTTMADVMEKNQIVIEKRGEVILLDIKGDMTSASETVFNETYLALENGVSKILLKFDPAAYINSGGIAVVIQMLAQTRRNKQLVGITGLSDHFQKIFKMVGITKFAAIYPSVEGGTQGLSD
jgi:anti-anti-sigma factor